MQAAQLEEALLQQDEWRRKAEWELDKNQRHIASLKEGMAEMAQVTSRPSDVTSDVDRKIKPASTKL